MAKEKIKVHYCKHCGKWRGKDKTCPECGKETIEKDLARARGDFYFIPGKENLFRRVTRILRVINKPGLNYWIAKQAVKAALENPLLSVNEAMASRFKQRDKAGDMGTSVHKMIETLSRGEKLAKEAWDNPYMKAYKKFCKEINFEIKGVEETVYSEKHGYAGTLDVFALVGDNKQPYILDYKTSNRIYDTVALQLTAYKYAKAEKEDDKKVLNYSMAAIHLKSDGTYSFVEVSDHWKEFRAVLALDKWQNG